MSVVYVVGAGASHGSALTRHPNTPDGFPTSLAATPLANGFFGQELYESIGYSRELAEADYPKAFSFIREVFFSRPPVEEDWETLNLRSDNYALLADSLGPGDTVVSFNWDLLLDQELHPTQPLGEQTWQYSNFLLLVWQKWLGRGTPVVAGAPRPGMFLKVHESLNWFQCRNSLCPATAEIELEENTQSCLSMNIGIGGRACERCGSEMLPLIIPPLLNKPITNNSIIRSVWGLAKQRLEEASHTVIVGFSAARTDFYAAWLLRSTVGVNQSVKTFVVNPANDPEHPEYNSFDSRMKEIFPHGYNSEFRRVLDIEAIIDRIREDRGPEHA